MLINGNTVAKLCLFSDKGSLHYQLGVSSVTIRVAAGVSVPS